MAADVVSPDAVTQGHGGTVVRDFAMQPTRPEKDGYYVYDNAVNVGALARVSLPIAVQCEKLLERRYSLFDFIVRAVVKACMSQPSWVQEGSAVNLLLFADSGQRVVALENVAGKSIYRLIREAAKAGQPPKGFYPHITVCDADISRSQVAGYFGCEVRPLFGFATRGDLPKTEIEIDSGISTGRYDTKTWEYSGYETLDEMYTAVVAVNVEAYICDSTVRAG